MFSYGRGTPVVAEYLGMLVRRDRHRLPFLYVQAVDESFEYWRKIFLYWRTICQWHPSFAEKWPVWDPKKMLGSVLRER